MSSFDCLYILWSENMDVAEVSGLNDWQTLLTDGQLSEVFVLQVGVDVSLFGIGVVFQLKLLLSDWKVLFSLVGEGGLFFDLVDGGIKVLGGSADLSLELSIFSL